MTGPGAARFDPEVPILVYDGDCGFCTSSARWVAARAGDRIDVKPWQALDLDQLGLTEAEVTSAAYVVEPDRTRLAGHRAVAATLSTLGWPWKPLGWVMARPPVSWLAAPVYRAVAANRYRLPGATDACRLDRP